jgi:hypothetical protein
MGTAGAIRYFSVFLRGTLLGIFITLLPCYYSFSFQLICSSWFISDTSEEQWRTGAMKEGGRNNEQTSF